MLLLKILMLLNIFSICAILGFSFGHRYTKRLNGLQDLQEVTRLLQTELLVFLTPIPIAIENILEKTSQPMTKVLSFMRDKIEKDEVGDLYAIFNEASYLLEEEYNLSPEDLEIFKSLGKVIGRSYRDNQELQIKYVLNSFQEQIHEAKEEKNMYGKMYGSLGIILGLGMIIILI